MTRISKALREQQSAQYLITTLCVWDVEQRWTLDRELAYAWDKGRFDDPYRQVLLPKYPATREGVCMALAVQFGTTYDVLRTHIAEGKVYPVYARPWTVALDSLQKLTSLVRFASYGTRIWHVAAGRMALSQAYREEAANSEQRSPGQIEARELLRRVGPWLHPDDAAAWITSTVTWSIPERRDPVPETHATVGRYRLLRDLWYAIGLCSGRKEQAAFATFLAADMPYQTECDVWQEMVLGGNTQHAAMAIPSCFAALGLAWPCTEEEVKHAYRTLAYQCHPDTGGTREAFQQLSEAYELALKYLDQVAQREKESQGG